MLAEFSPAERRAIRILAFITIVSRLALAFRPEWRIATRPYIDDTFYVFNVCQHFVAGQGLSVDGFQLTNGIQPLIAFIYMPFFWIANGDKLLAIRLIFIVPAIVDSLSLIFFAKLIRRLLVTPNEEEKNIWLRPPIVGALAWAALYPILVHTMNGLETGIYSLLVLISLYRYYELRSKHSTNLQWLGFGVLLGLTVLARIDAVFFVIAIAAAELWRDRAKAIPRVAICCAAAIIISSPWWIYNFEYFGSIMPQSGQAESAQPDVLRWNIAYGISTLSNIAVMIAFLPKYSLPEWFHYVWTGVVGVALYLFLTRSHIVSYLKRHIAFGALVPLVLHGAMLLVFYLFLFAAPFFFERYFQPIRILWLIMLVGFVPQMTQWYRHRRQTHTALAKAGLATILVVAAGFTLTQYVYHFIIPTPFSLYQTAEWAQAHPSDMIGMAQSGIGGYFAPNIVNLDGKVNPAALRAIQHGGIGTYVANSNIKYIADWMWILLPIVRSSEQHGAPFEKVDSIGQVFIFKRVR
jgi:hypothetical protein